MGRSTAAGPAWVRIVRRSGRPCDEPAGAASADGLVCGTVVHGLLADAAVRHALLETLWRRRGPAARRREDRGALTLDERLDGLADLVSRHLDLDRVRAIAGLSRR